MERTVEYLEDGKPLLFSANDDGLPAIQDVSDAKHLGCGLFEAEVGGGGIYFDGGGAMDTLEKDGEYLISWTLVRGDTEEFIDEFGYDFDEVKSDLKDML